MTDEPLTEEPAVQKLSVVDNDKLEKAIAAETTQREADHREILTAPQQRLQAEEMRHAELATDKVLFKSDIDRTKASIENLKALLTKSEQMLRDVEVEDTSVLASIHQLRSGGIDL